MVFEASFPLLEHNRQLSLRDCLDFQALVEKGQGPRQRALRMFSQVLLKQRKCPWANFVGLLAYTIVEILLFDLNRHKHI